MSSWPPVDGGGGGGLGDPGANGIVVRNALNTTVARTLAATAPVTVTNGDGVAGNPTIGLTTPITVAQGGTGQTTALAARGASGLNIESLSLVLDATYNAVSTDRVILYQTLTLPRAVNLPAVAGFNPGEALIIGDESGNCNTTNVITINRAGADTIDNGTVWLLAAPNHMAVLIADPVNGKWTVDNGHLAVFHNLSDVASQQASLNNIAGAVTNNRVLAGDGTNVTLRALLAADLPASALVSGDVTVNRQEFTTSGTWTKPANALFVIGRIVGGGGGGGAGRRGAAASVRGGGAGGASGGVNDFQIRASDLGATETVTIGAGGSGGAAQTVDNTNGAAGTNGGASTFGTTQHAIAGGNFGTAAGGAAGIASGGTGASTTQHFGALFGGAIFVTIGGGNGGDGTTAPGAGGNGAAGMTGGGGGGGGGIPAGNTNQNGAVGGAEGATGSGGGAAGTGAGGNGGNATAPNQDYDFGSGGGGGASNAAGVGGTGGNGAARGGGGGGGGASVNGSNSGAGGNGGAGYCIVYTICARGGTT